MDGRRDLPVLLTAAFTVACGASVAIQNSDSETGDDLLIACVFASPVVGFLVARWWVVIAVVGPVFGRTIGWDAGENDGNPALWPPYVFSTIALFGLPLAAGLALGIVGRYLVGVVRDGSLPPD